MNPSDLRKHLPAYADGELEPDLRQEIEACVASDPQTRAEVQRWQALRQATRRALESEPVPAELADRVRTALRAGRTGRVPRLYRLGLSGLAVAAAAVFVFFLWPRGAAATPVKASKFAGIYRTCALAHGHDELKLRGLKGCHALEKARRCAQFPCKVLDVTAGGHYAVDGGCCCSPAQSLRVLHVYFRAESGPQEVVSAFTVDRRIILCSDDGAPCRRCQFGRRHYHSACDGDVVVLGWDEGDRSYVLVARIDEQQLLRLADGVPLAAAPFTQAADQAESTTRSEPER